MKPEDRDYVLNKVKEWETECRGFMAAVVNPFPKIEIPSYTLPKIIFPKIEIPEIDYERIETITNDNSRYGGTSTGEMGIGE